MTKLLFGAAVCDFERGPRGLADQSVGAEKTSAPSASSLSAQSQDAVSGIPPAEQQQEIAAALEAEKERRLELKSKIDELSTEEIERLLSFSGPRVGATKIAGFHPQV
jgi:hypothetical protein